MSDTRSYSVEEFLERGKNPPPPTEEERALIRRELRQDAFRAETCWIIADWLRVDVAAVEEEARQLGLLPQDPPQPPRRRR